MNKALNASYLTPEKLRELGVADAEERNIKIHETAVIVDLSNISFGRNIRIDPFCVISCSQLELGDYVHIASGCSLSGASKITIEDFGGLAPDCRLFSSTDDYSGKTLTNPTVPSAYKNVHSADVRLGRHVIIGCGTVILPGVNVGDGACVGAMSLVKNDLETWTINAGVPAKRLGPRSQECLKIEKALINK